MIFSYPKLSVDFSLLWMTLPLKTPGEAADEKMTSFAMELAEVRKDLMVEKEPWSRKLTTHFKKMLVTASFLNVFFEVKLYKMEVWKNNILQAAGAWNGLKDFESLVRLVASIKQSRNSVSHLLLTLKASCRPKLCAVPLILSHLHLYLPSDWMVGTVYTAFQVMLVTMPGCVSWEETHLPNHHFRCKCEFLNVKPFVGRFSQEAHLSIQRQLEERRLSSRVWFFDKGPRCRLERNLILLMVQKSEGQPPGMYNIKPCK